MNHNFTKIDFFIMGEAKRRKELGIPPREKQIKLTLPELDKNALQKKVRSTLYKYPIIPLIFYAFAILLLIGSLLYAAKFYKYI